MSVTRAPTEGAIEQVPGVHQPTRWVGGKEPAEVGLRQSVNQTPTDSLVPVPQAYLHSMNIIHRDLNSHNCLVREVSSAGGQVCWGKKRPVGCPSRGFRRPVLVQQAGTPGLAQALPFITWQRSSDPARVQGFNRSEKGKLMEREKPRLSLQFTDAPEIAQATQEAATATNQRVGRGIWAGFWKRRRHFSGGQEDTRQSAPSV